MKPKYFIQDFADFIAFWLNGLNSRILCILNCCAMKNTLSPVAIISSYHFLLLLDWLQPPCGDKRFIWWMDKWEFKILYFCFAAD